MATDERVVVEFDQHTPEYRETYPAKAHELREQCPVAWSTKHDGFWIVTGHEALSALELGANVPEALWVAVAKTLAWAYKLDARASGRS